MRYRHSPPFFSFGLGDSLFSFCLFSHQLRADIPAHIDIGNINGENLKGRTRIETFCENRA